MTQEDKDLLLKDLCARLPYGVCAELPNHHLVMHIYSIKSINMENGWTTGILECAGRKKIYSAQIEDVKPYLRPMSSMTEEEKVEYTSYCFEQPFLQKGETPNLGSVPMCVDWLNKKMFDFRGLIPKGLAIEVTEENNPYKD